MTGVPLTIDRLERWVLFGAEWRVAEVTDERATIDFYTCMGEFVERAATADPGVIEYVRAARPV